jgi:16S rRNA (guanine527-N7)-methyltransferase
LTATQVALLARFRDLLLEWNGRFNLTGLDDPVLVEQRLLGDALLMLPAVDGGIAASGVKQPRLIDIGSGGGLPAIPLAICRPELSVTMVEATAKKVGFLRAVMAELSLRQTAAIHSRAEDAARDLDHRAAYEIVTARAVASLPALIELSMPFLRPNGLALFPKGRDIEEELRAGTIAAAEIGAKIGSTHRLAGSETRLVIVRKQRPTPERFPRRAGLPAREPLGGLQRTRAATGGEPQ